MRRATDLLFALSATVIIVLSVLRADVFWRNEAYLDETSGTWTAHAQDLVHGVLYRPLQGPLGYGGSRYFPMHFAVHAALMKVFGSPIGTGFAESAAAMVLLMGGVYVLLRAFGASQVLALSCAAFVLAIRPSQEALLSIKGDGLAAALNLLGVAVCAVAGGLGGTMVAAALFALAFATKLTSVSGVVAAVLWRWFSGKRWSAVTLALGTATGMVVVLLLMQVGSHGVAFGVFRASAAGGGTYTDMLRAPFNLARQARRVPETLVFIQLGCAACLALLFRPKPLTLGTLGTLETLFTNLPLLFFVSVLAVTIVIFGSPGTDTNHFIDLHVASVVLVASWLAGPGLAIFDLGAYALIVAALAASLSLVSGLMSPRTEQRHGLLADALKLIPDRSKPILAQNPLVPIAAGQRPYLIDGFMMRLLTARDPAFATPLQEDIKNQRFAAVVFENDPRVGRARELFRTAMLGEPFVEAVERSYEFAGIVGTRTVYLPRPAADRSVLSPPAETQ